MTDLFGNDTQTTEVQSALWSVLDCLAQAQSHLTKYTHPGDKTKSVIDEATLKNIIHVYLAINEGVEAVWDVMEPERNPELIADIQANRIIYRIKGIEQGYKPNWTCPGLK